MLGCTEPPVAPVLAISDPCFSLATTGRFGAGAVDEVFADLLPGSSRRIVGARGNLAAPDFTVDQRAVQELVPPFAGNLRQRDFGQSLSDPLRGAEGPPVAITLIVSE